jgi:hypothetical protein
MYRGSQAHALLAPHVAVTGPREKGQKAAQLRTGARELYLADGSRRNVRMRIIPLADATSLSSQISSSTIDGADPRSLRECPWPWPQVVAVASAVAPAPALTRVRVKDSKGGAGASGIRARSRGHGPWGGDRTQPQIKMAMRTRDPIPDGYLLH